MISKNQAIYMMNVYKILSNDKCFRILKVLDDAENLFEGYKMNVTEILVKARLYEAETSTALNKMKRFGLVSSIRDGKFVRYTINKKMLDELGCIETYIDNLKIK